MKIKDLSLEQFQLDNRIKKEDWLKADIKWELLQDIGDDYIRRLDELKQMASLHAGLLQSCPAVHSVRWRIKDVQHVLEKIVRKRAKSEEKYADINTSNYTNKISDLIGLRALHLFKFEWKEIHDYLSNGWDKIETPKAFIRIGDPEDITALYEANSCAVDRHEHNYRSVHYIISSRIRKDDILAEIQVRTIFEEGWSEIDHKVRYPNFSPDGLILTFLATFNRIAGTADEMGSFVYTLAATLESKAKEQELQQEKFIKQIEEIKEIKNLKEKDKNKIIAEVIAAHESANIAEVKKNNIDPKLLDEILSFRPAKIKPELLDAIASIRPDFTKNIASLVNSSIDPKIYEIARNASFRPDISKDIANLIHQTIDADSIVKAAHDACLRPDIAKDIANLTRQTINADSIVKAARDACLRPDIAKDIANLTRQTINVNSIVKASHDASIRADITKDIESSANTTIKSDSLNNTEDSDDNSHNKHD
jgi:putative GTP pyrophosphokinase